MLCFKFFRIFVESNINVLPTGMVQSKDSENSKVELRRRITVSALEAFNQTSPEFYRDLQKYPRFIELKNKHIEQNRTEAVKFLEKGKAQGLFRSDVRFDLILDLLHLQLENTFEKHLDSKYDIKEIFYYVVVTLFRGCATAKGLQVINDFLEKYPDIIPKHIKTNDA